MNEATPFLRSLPASSRIDVGDVVHAIGHLLFQRTVDGIHEQNDALCERVYEMLFEENLPDNKAYIDALYESIHVFGATQVIYAAKDYNEERRIDALAEAHYAEIDRQAE